MIIIAAEFSHSLGQKETSQRQKNLPRGRVFSSAVGQSYRGDGSIFGVLPVLPPRQQAVSVHCPAQRLAHGETAGDLLLRHGGALLEELHVLAQLGDHRGPVDGVGGDHVDHVGRIVVPPRHPGDEQDQTGPPEDEDVADHQPEDRAGVDQEGQLKMTKIPAYVLIPTGFYQPN